MKKFYLFVLMALMTATAFAQPKKGVVNRADLSATSSRFQLAPGKAVAKTPSETDIITEQPAGTVKRYLRTGRAMMGSWGEVYEYDQNGSVSKVVFGDDGESVYFYMPLSSVTYPAWVKGTLSTDGTTITVPAGQQIVYGITEPDPDEGYEGGEVYAFRLHLMELKDGGNGTFTYVIAEGDPDIVWTVDQATGELRLTCTDVDAYNIMGIVYDTPESPEDDGQWNGYADYNTVYVPFNDEPTVMPEGLQTEQYSMLYEQSDSWSGTKVLGKLVDVAFQGNDVYVTHFSADYPETCIKGTIEGDKVVFPRQLMLVNEYNDAVYFGTYTSTRVDFDWGDFYYEHELSYDDVVFTYDAETRSFSTDMNFDVNASAIVFSGQEMFEKPQFKPFNDVPARPADPEITTFDGYEGDNGYICYAYFTIPTSDVDGNFINPNKLYFRFYTSENELYHFQRDNYVRHEETDGWDFEPTWEDGMTEIPYYYKDEASDISAENAYFRYGELNRLGLQSIYRGGGEEHCSNIYFYGEGIVTAIVTPGNEKTACGKDVYDLQGRRVSSVSKGIYVQSVKHADGTVSNRKVVLK